MLVFISSFKLKFCNLSQNFVRNVQKNFHGSQRKDEILSIKLKCHEYGFKFLCVQSRHFEIKDKSIFLPFTHRSHFKKKLF